MTLCRSLALGAAALCVAACSRSDPSIHASDYSSTCSTPGDPLACVVITAGPISCCSAECGGKVAINRADLERFQADLLDRAPECGGIVCPNVACAQPLAVCDLTGTCQVGDTCGDPDHPVPCQ